jgi:hypothetical protein
MVAGSCLFVLCFLLYELLPVIVGMWPDIEYWSHASLLQNDYYLFET